MVTSHNAPNPTYQVSRAAAEAFEIAAKRAAEEMLVESMLLKNAEEEAKAAASDLADLAEEKKRRQLVAGEESIRAKELAKAPTHAVLRSKSAARGVVSTRQLPSEKIRRKAGLVKLKSFRQQPGSSTETAPTRVALALDGKEGKEREEDEEAYLIELSSQPGPLLSLLSTSASGSNGVSISNIYGESSKSTDDESLSSSRVTNPMLTDLTQGSSKSRQLSFSNIYNETLFEVNDREAAPDRCSNRMLSMLLLGGAKKHSGEDS